jgi:membrane protease YdiL (CAAX protease family)
MSAGNIAAFDTGKTTSLRSKRRDLFELCIGYSLILVVIWTPSPWQRWFYWLAIAFIVTATWRSFEGWVAMGLRLTNLLRALWIPGVALLAAAIAVVVATHLHTLRPWRGTIDFIQRFWGYALWAFAQQFLLLDYFLLRLLRLIPDGRLAAVTAAAIFALAHLPNPILTPITFAFGLASCALFLHYRNLYPLAIAHVIFGICIAIALPGPVTHNMRVGLGYLTYRPNHGHHHRIQLSPQPY